MKIDQNLETEAFKRDYIDKKRQCNRCKELTLQQNLGKSWRVSINPDQVQNDHLFLDHKSTFLFPK